MADSLIDLQYEFRDHYVSRRDFIRRATALGLSLSAAVVFLESCGGSPATTTPGRAIKMGALVPLTGFLAVLGPAMKNNAQMAVDDVNGHGGILGSQIQLQFEDTASDPNTAVQKAKKLINDDKVDVIIGTLSSAERWAVALSATNPAKAIFINPTYYEGGICNRYFFNVGALPNQQIDPFIPWLMQNKSAKTFFLGGSDYAWPHGSFAAVKAAVAKAGGQIVGEEYSPLGATDFSGTLRKMQAAKPDVVYPLYAGGDGITFLKQLVSFGLHKSSLVASTALSELIIGALPVQDSTGWVASFEYFMTIDTPENKDFVQRYQARFGKDEIMDAIGQGMRTCVDLYANGAQKAGSIDKEKVVDSMKTVQFTDPKGNIHIDATSQSAYLNDFIAVIGPPGSGPAWQRFQIVNKVSDVQPVQTCQSKPPS
jgi:urea transport system substrate-binding protein